MPNLTSVRATEFNWSIQSYQLEGSKKGYYGSLDFFSLHVTSCNVHSSVVEVEVSCVKPGAQLHRSCRSARIRNAPGQEPLSNATVFSRGDVPGNPLGSYPAILLHDLVRVDLATHNSEFNAFQMYLSDPTAGFANTASDGDELQCPYCNVRSTTWSAHQHVLGSFSRAVHGFKSRRHKRTRRCKLDHLVLRHTSISLRKLYQRQCVRY